MRKTLVFCMVDAYFIMDKEVYDRYLARFNVNQQKLITIYIERKTSSSMNNEWMRLTECINQSKLNKYETNINVKSYILLLNLL